MIDYRERYKPLFRVKTGDYAVIEEHSKKPIHKGPLTYGEAQDIADLQNELKAERVRKAIALTHDG
jgi:hypothetical protein